jgi:hypothetical protein
VQELVVDHNWVQELVVDHNWVQELVVDHNWVQVGVTLARPLDSIEGTGLSPCNPWSRHGKWIVHIDYRRIRRAGSDDRSIGLALELLLDCPDCLELRHVLKERGAWMVPLVVGRHLSLRRRN